MAKSTFDSNNSAYEKYLENTFMNVPRSRHDLSHVHTGQTTFGILAPVLCLETMPNEDIDLNLTASIQLRNPTPRPLINGCRVYFHAYYNRCRDLWEGFENFVTHGRRQDVQLSKPKLRYIGAYLSSDPDDGFQSSLNYCSPLSLMDFMGIPSFIRQTAWYNRSGTIAVGLDSFRGALYLKSGDDLIGTTQSVVPNSDNVWIDALPFVAYQRNWRDFYSPKNLLMNNKQWFPDNENEFLLPYECERAAFLSHDSPDFVAGSDRARFFGLASDSSESDVLSSIQYWFGGTVPAAYLTPDVFAPSSSESSVDYPVLAAIKFRCFSGDRFTSGSPFVDLVRGSIPSLEGYVSLVGSGNSRFPIKQFDSYSGSLADLWFGLPSSANDYQSSLFNGNDSSTSAGLGFELTQNDLRKLETITVLRERLARTDGDYSDMIGALFGERPSKESHEGIYIGGCYQDVVFSSVTQTSQSTDDSQLGDKAGQGYSVSNGRIGHFHSDDYGWIQVYMSIVPETYYTQGLDAQFSRDVSDKLWNPLMSNMPPQAVLNKEVFISGDSSVDELPFSYEQRGNEYRSRRNRVSGFSSLPHEVAAYDSSIVMSRRFISSPSFNSKFLYMTPENIDMDVFSFNDEPPFDFSIGFDLSVVLPMPSVSVPGAMSSGLHA